MLASIHMPAVIQKLTSNSISIFSSALPLTHSRKTTSPSYRISSESETNSREYILIWLNNWQSVMTWNGKVELWPSGKPKLLLPVFEVL
jgi:hypothetical protein